MNTYSSYLGTTLKHRYEVRSLLGEGAVGQVFRVWDTQAREIRALKLIDTQKKKFPLESVLRFKTEAHILASLEHPSIVHYVDFFQENSVYALVMEYLQAPTLSEHLRHHAPLPLPDLWKLLKSLAQALFYLHDHKRVHHDLKSSNLLFQSSESEGFHIKILDFGLSHLKSVSRNVPVGTVAYMAPEQTGLLQKVRDHRADLYSLGIILYESATGKLPFYSEDPALLMHLHVAQAPVPPQELRPELCPFLNAIILKLLQKDPEDRYRTTQGLLRDIEKFQRLIAQGKAVSSEIHLGEEDTWDNLPSELPFVGRSQEMQRLRDAWTQVEHTKKGKVVVTEGISGVGKTRLLQEFYNELGTQEHFCWFYRNLQEEVDLPFKFFRKLFQNIPKMFRTLPQEEQFKKIRHFQDVLGRRFALFLELVPELQSWAEEASEERTSWSQEDYHEVIEKTLEMMTQYRSPITVLIDDFHHLDRASHEFLLRIAENKISELPILWVCALEKAAMPEELRKHADQKLKEKTITFLPLEHLSIGHYRELLQQVFSYKLYGLPQLLVMLHEETGGSPGQLRLLLTQLLDSKGIVYHQLEWQIHPEAIEQLLQERHASAADPLRFCCSLSPEARLLLQRGAVFQRAFSIEALEVAIQTAPALENCSLEIILATLDRAIELQVLSVNEQGLYSFRDPLIRRSFLEKIHESLQKKVHREIALYLEEKLLPQNPDTLYDMVLHWGKTGEHETALRMCVRAAEKTDAGVYQNQQSRFYYNGAIEILKCLPVYSMDPEFEFELRDRTIRFNAMALDRYDPLWQDALRMEPLTEGNRTRQVRLLSLKAYLSNLLGKKEEGMRLGEQCLQLAEPEDEPYLANTYNSLGSVASNKSFEERLQLLEKGVQLAHRYKHLDQASTLIVQTTLLAYMGRFAEAEQTLNNNLNFLEKHHFLALEQLCFYGNSILNLYRGSFQEIRRLHEEIKRSETPLLFVSRGKQMEQVFMSWTWGMTGDLDKALELYEVLLQKGEKLEQQWDRSLILEGRIQIALFIMEEAEDALEFLEEAEMQMQRRPDRYMSALFAIYTAWSKMMLNLWDEAESALAEANVIAEKLESLLLTAHLDFAQAKLNWHQNPTHEARKKAEKVLSIFLEMGATGYYELYREEIKKWNSRTGTESTTSSLGTASSQNSEMFQLMEINRKISSTLDLETLFQSILEGAMKIVGAEQGYLFICDGSCILESSKQEIEEAICNMLKLTLNAHNQKIVRKAHRYSPSILKKVFETQKAVITRDARREQKWKDDSVIQKHQLRSVLAVPIVHQKTLKGLLYLDNAQIRSVFSVQDQETVGMFATQVAIALNNAETYAREQEARKQQEATLRVFERFVPRQFTERLISGGIESLVTGMAEQEDSLSILFSDIRSFTTLSEGLEPEALFLFLNAYLRHMEVPIHENRGFVDKFIGDAIMALFDQAPQDAVHAGLAMQDALKCYNATRKKQGLEAVRAGIGINTGAVTVGVIGSETRMDTTVLGDAVNIASRIESLTKYYGCSFLISGDTKNVLSDTSKLHLRLVDILQVKGRKSPTKLYEIFNGDSSEMRDLKVETQTQFQAAFESYQQGFWKEALELFTNYQKNFPQDPLSCVFQGRCERFLITPPETWNGVFHLDRK